MEHVLVAYLLNVAWQLPLVAATAAAAKALLRPSARIEHWMWLAALLASVLLPTIPFLLARSDLAAASSALPPPAAQGSAIPADVVSQSAVAASVVLTPTTAHVLAALYLGMVAMLVSALLRSLLRIRRLVRSSRPLTLPPRLQDRLARLCLQDLPQPQFRESDALDSPAVVGALKPVLLVPSEFCRRDNDLVVSALLHELAHVSRRDYALNLCCRCLFLAVGWHPVSWLIASAVHESRELACDEAAAGALGSRKAYAENLVTLARSLVMGAPPPPAPAVGLLRHKLIEKRVKRLVTRRRRIAGPLTACRAACVAAIMSASAYASATIRVAAVYDDRHIDKADTPDRPFTPSVALRRPLPSSPPLPLQTDPERQHRLADSPAALTRSNAITTRGAGGDQPLPRDRAAGDPDQLPTAADGRDDGRPTSPVALAGPTMTWDATRAAQFARDMAAARRGAADASRPWRSGALQRDMEAARQGAEDASRPWRSGALQRDMGAARQGVLDAHPAGN
jgi:beta-lactamase regulating signal transducer with metallopeptidase domain